MGTWLASVLHVLGGDSARRQQTLQTLRSAQRAHLKITLQITCGAKPLVLISTIEQVRDADVVIAQPTIGGLTHPLAFGEQVTIGFVHESRYHTGECECLGRVRIPAGTKARTGETVLLGYGLSMPESLGVQERQLAPRAEVHFEHPVEAQLYAPASMRGPIFGHVDEVSMIGVKILTHLPREQVEVGQRVYLKAMLPEPAGLVDEVVTITRMDFDRRTGRCLIAAHFGQRLDGIEHLLRMTSGTTATRVVESAGV